MPFATAEDGVRIHYEVAGLEGGPPLVLHHGVYSDLQFWRQRRRGRPSYVELLGERFRLILLDARGHGLSDQPTQVEDYDFRTRVLDVLAVMGDAGVQSAHFAGYSMGAHVGMSAAIYAPQRFRSLFLGGASPYGAVDFSMTQRPWDETWPFVGELPHAHREAWGALSAAQWHFGGAIQALRTTALPYVLFAGERDAGPHRGVTRFASEQRAARPVDHFVVPHANHLEAATHLDEVVPRLVAFVDRVEAALA
ncbi:MAG: alpha/beta fold hydrolase [Dehalococcoidia bacterium]|nr:alpha/beta fold hydrolase [Dehalococcoidia bacterium]